MSKVIPIHRQIEDLREEVEVLRLAQDRLYNVMHLQMALKDSGLEVLEYDGPSRYDLGHVTQCELCGEPLDVLTVSYELFLRSKAWGLRYGYVHRVCFEQVLRME
ncbi:MAG: hypothetical protein GXX95_01145 [Methanomassiliicoccus sp.]|nr:hypothetical protein [Methanomassiliicoccus sp.]